MYQIHYPEQKILISCLLLWAENSNFLLKIEIWHKKLPLERNIQKVKKDQRPKITTAWMHDCFSNYLWLLFFGGKAGGGEGLKLSEETKRPLGGKVGGGGFELSEPSSMDKRLSVEADLLLEFIIKKVWVTNSWSVFSMTFN